MCGFAGLLESSATTPHSELETLVGRMAQTLRHRGPDDSGAWADAAFGIALGFRRLSIIDLSPAGHQPMQSASGRYTIVFNGEIYNYSDLRNELDRPWRGHSDTEVMLAGFEEWGVEATVRRLNGMFAFALWDAQERTLFLSRDRLGEKPLYYGWLGGTFLFASELKALRAHPAFQADLDRDALALSLRHNCIPAPYSIYRNVRKLPPATLLKVKAGDRDSQPVPYWSLREAAERGVREPFTGSDAEALEQLDRLLRDAVRIRMISDVPLGAFLSGGIDSSTIVALMQVQSDRPVRTFSIGLREASYNEAADAQAVARHLGTEHTEFYVTPAEALAVIPHLPEYYDEPFADSSQIPTSLVARLARQYVTVGLSGDGGDEFFGGYNRYTWTRKLWKNIGWLPGPLRRGMAGAVSSVSPQAWDSFFSAAGPVLPRSFRQRTPGDRLHKLAGALGSSDIAAMYISFASHWTEPDRLVLGATEPPTLLTRAADRPVLSDPIQQMMYFDAMTYLPDDILVKVDRATMAHSLEGRIPFLDHRLVEFAWTLPLPMKVRDGQGKWLLRQLLYRHVPPALVDRPKFGFGIPIDSWLRNDLRDWAEALLDESRLRREGFFNPAPIREKWAEHLSGRRNWQHHLWDVLMFQSWLEHTHAPVLAGAVA
jgi:asparagine synthase (glutamine-hydrolysing)